MDNDNLRLFDWGDPRIWEKEFMLLIPLGEEPHLRVSLFQNPIQPFRP